ncbi:diguanylate cyclase [Ralstonia pickettii]|uniref:diguanylate cyclase n=1 Tax=Ralstonia pickettii TaxID=329 RepID=UPI0015BD14C4|nr:diguanylate cyclase [Ralstonia pickettii]NWK46783.1 diguanylate cyclase [Ralstonia pickettii]
MHEPFESYLMYFLIPLWVAAGVADWLCHRATRIERTSGAKESLLHLLMLAEMGVPVLAALFLQINALVLVMMAVAYVVHQATAMWDVSYAVSHRTVKPFEQHVHSFLEMIPLMALSVVALLHWNEVLGLFGMGSASPDFSLRWKEPPLPWGYVATVLSIFVALELLPYAEELVRCLRHRRAAPLVAGQRRV